MTSEISWLTALILIAGAYIAWQQMYVARRKFILDLFDHRSQVFTAAERFLARAANGNLGPGDDIKFLQDTSYARFLFDGDVMDALTEISKITSEKRARDTIGLSATDTAARTEAIQQQLDVAERMRVRLATLADLFAPYMRITYRLRPSRLETWLSASRTPSQNVAVAVKDAPRD